MLIPWHVDVKFVIFKCVVSFPVSESCHSYLTFSCAFCGPQIVKHHSQEVGLQRRVFVDFFCNPERLRNQVRELTARVRALQVS